MKEIWEKIKGARPTAWLVFAFIVLFVVLISKEADAAEPFLDFAPETTAVGGTPYTGSFLLFGERFKGKYDIGIGLTLEGTCRSDDVCRSGDMPRNQFVLFQRIVTYKKFEMGLGFSYWHNQSAAWNSNTPFALHIGFNPSDRFVIRWRHFSTGGSSSNNGGFDLLTAGWKF